MKCLLWKIKFTFWYLRFKGWRGISYQYAVTSCYEENHDGHHLVLTPRDSAAEIINWSRK